MTWPVTDFEKRSFADLAGDLASLCLAVNEREAALALVETEFSIYGKTPWVDGTVYRSDSSKVIGSDGEIYICTAPHTSDTDNEPITGVNWTDYWELFAADWVTATDYEGGGISKVVGSDGKIYACWLTHTSDTVDKPITGANWEDYWTLYVEDWVTANDYTIEPDEVVHNSKAYECTQTHISNAETEPGGFFGWADYWDVLIDTAWVTATSYTLDAKVMNDDVAYICIHAHTSSAGDEPGVGGDWEDEWDVLIDTAWVTATQYEIGPDRVEANDEELYSCYLDHTSATDNEPGVGVDWEDYWVRVADDWGEDLKYKRTADAVLDTDEDSSQCIISHKANEDNRPVDGSINSSYWVYGPVKTTRPYALELSGFSLGGEDFRDTIIEVQVAAESLVEDNPREKFVENRSGQPDEWTHASLIADIDMGDFTTDFDWWEADVWERLRLYLDALVYCYIYPLVKNATGPFSKANLLDDTRQEAWDGARADEYFAIQGSRMEWWSDWVGIPTPFTFAAIICVTQVWTLDTAKYFGVVWFGVVHGRKIEKEAAQNISVQVGTNAYTIVAGDGNGGITNFPTTYTVTADTEVVYEINSIVPADHPFAPDVWYSECYIGLEWLLFDGGLDGSFFRFNLDISGELTDQT